MSLLTRVLVPLLFLAPTVSIAAAKPAPAEDATAEPTKERVVPETLKAWIPWVLRNHASDFCPARYNNQGQKVCAWPGKLTLESTKTQANFSLDWVTFTPMFVTIPGDEKAWPYDVTVDGKPAAVIEKDGWPQVWLPRGTHRMAGHILWRSLPESLHIPQDTALLAVTINGKAIRFADVSSDGRLWLQQEKKLQPEGEEEKEQQTDVFELNVQRHVVDDIPLLVETRMDLNVSGKNRDIVLAGAILPGFIVESISSTLPIKLEKDQKIHVKIRPGKWDIRITGRYSENAPAELKIPPHEAPWPDEEIWVFDARPNLRLAQIEGVPSIDPKQTAIPAEWQQFPTYKVTVADTFKIKEQQRGHSEPRPPKISLSRDIWLDFSGEGYTQRDQLLGQLTAVTRLTATPPIALGRAEWNGQPQLITKLEGTSGEGVEAQPGTLRLIADSRVNSPTSTLPAVGWNINVDDANIRLHLPPGYRLFTVFGADSVSNTWMEFWNLVHIFLVALLVGATAMLFDKRIAALTAFTMIICYPEWNFPQYMWFVLFGGFAALRFIPQAMMKRLGIALVTITLFFLSVDSLFFSVEQIQKALYPVLERRDMALGENNRPTYLDAVPGINRREPSDMKMKGGKADNDEVRESEANDLEESQGDMAADGAGGDASEPAGSGDMAASASADMAASASADKAASASADKAASVAMEAPAAAPSPAPAQKAERSYSSLSKGKSISAKKSVRQKQILDPKANVQTGPGLPNWDWRVSNIQWQGTVPKDHTFRMALMPPWLNSLLGFLRVLSLVLLLAIFINAARHLITALFADTAVWQRLKGSSATVLVFLALAFLAPKTLHAETPNAAQLQELERWLLEPSPCGASCVSIEKLTVLAAGQELTLSFGAHAYAQAAFPVPGYASQWSLQSVTVDGQPTSALQRDPDGSVWLVVKPGLHIVRLQGVLPSRDSVPLALPLRPHMVSFTSGQWDMDGVNDERIEDTLVFKRRKGNEDKQDTEDPEDVANPTLPSYVQIERRITLGLTWTVSTTVTRISSSPIAIQASIPLLKGEAVTTAGIRVDQGHAMINLPAEQWQTQWQSVLEQAPKIEMTAEKTDKWQERWVLETSPIWHVDTAGIPEVEEPNSDSSLRVWRPWPGESVSLTVARPTPSDGQTQTIDQVSLKVKPGVRALSAALTLRVRASLGGQHTIKLAEDAEISSLKVDAQQVPIRQDKGKVTFPVHPGTQTVEIEWRENRGISTLFTNPSVDLQSPAVNVSLQTNMAEERWILLTGGPRVGPVVLYWGFTITILILSFFLGKLNGLPIKNYEWLLLGLGLSYGDSLSVMVVFGFLLVLGLRSRLTFPKHPVPFNLLQIALVIWAFVTLGILSNLLWDGFLHLPQMRLSGNSSSIYQLNWFLDRMSGELARPWVFSVSILWYRGLTLLWALWLARFTLRMLPFAWKNFAIEGILRKIVITPRIIPNTKVPKDPPKDIDP